MLVFVFLLLVELVLSAVNTPVVTLDALDNEIASEEQYECPRDISLLSYFSRSCKTCEDCADPAQLCCRVGERKVCRQRIVQALPEQKHIPFLPGVPRRCPKEDPIIEILPVQNCTTDEDCRGRICCPSGRTGYCRTAVHEWNNALPPSLVQTLNIMVSYLQCTSPPPPLLDLFPKPCRNPFDCFPNLCCQEHGKKICRPPKRSISAELFQILATQQKYMYKKPIKVA